MSEQCITDLNSCAINHYTKCSVSSNTMKVNAAVQNNNNLVTNSEKSTLDDLQTFDTDLILNRVLYEHDYCLLTEQLSDEEKFSIKKLKKHKDKKHRSKKKKHRHQKDSNCKEEAFSSNEDTSERLNKSKSHESVEAGKLLNSLSSKDVKKELIDVPFDRKGQLYETISHLTEPNEIKSDKEDNMTENTSSTGRTQRIRKKPKRWLNDEVEVDFTGQLPILETSKRKTSESKPENCAKKRKAIKEESDSANSSDSDNEEVDNDSDYAEEEEEETGQLWCICRQPYDERFMIGCDSCEEWFHGKCVNVTKVQGRKMEKNKEEWFCPTCVEGFKNGLSREELKEQALARKKELEMKESIEVKNKKSSKKKTIKRKPEPKSKHKESQNKSRSDSDSSTSSIDAAHNVSRGKDGGGSGRRSAKMSKELEERRKLQKLIQASKKDLIKKEKLREQLELEHMEHSSDMNTSVDEFGKVVVVVNRGKETLKKKHKTEIVDQSLQDLFKAEPVLMRSQSTSSTSSPGSPRQRKSSGSIDSRRASSSSIVSLKELCCVSCGKPLKSSEQLHAIYCNNNCIENHVNEMLKLWRNNSKRAKEHSISGKHLKLVLINRKTSKMLCGKDAVSEKIVLEFIGKNPTYEILKPNISVVQNNNHSSSSSNSGKSVPTTPTKTKPSKSDSKSHPSSTITSSTPKLERSSSISNENDSNRRKFMRNSLNEIFTTRSKEVNDKTKISAEEILKLSNQIEDELFKIFKCTNNKYNVKSRSLIFNLKDPKNSLFRKVLSGKITPERLVNMSAEELASAELARWREMEKKTMIELITRDAVDQANQVIVKKTHKGEEFIENTDLILDLPAEVSLTSKNDQPSSKIIEANESNATVVAATTPILASNENKASSTNSAALVIADSGETATTTTTTTPATVVTGGILDVLDTTSQHKSHVYSNNCKICTKSEESEPQTPTSVKPEKETEVPNRSQPIRVRVEHESTSKFLQKVVKLSDKLKSETAEPSNDTVVSPKEISEKKLSDSKVKHNSHHEMKNAKCVWKGTIFMQEVAKFVASAHNISGTLALNLSQDISDQITVCGRITPEQVLDYVAKLKSSKRTEIGIFKFMWPCREERTGYDAFFNYLNLRCRYGVVGNTSKTFKDFYILPLSRNSDIPKVLLPIDGPGIEKKLHRPNLLLGIVIRSRKLSPVQSTAIPIAPTVHHSASHNEHPASTNHERSYTPPLEASTTPPFDPAHNDDGSYTPPHVPAKRASEAKFAATRKSAKYEPYDPENATVDMEKAKLTSANLNELMEKVSNSTNPMEMTTSVLNAVASTEDYELKQTLLNHFSERVDSQLSKTDKDERISLSSNSIGSTVLPPPAASSANPVSLDNVFSNIKNIQIPDNLKDILKTIQEKTPASESRSNDYAVKSSDPRLRVKKSTASPAQPVAASMSQDELLRKAQEQMAALAQMEMQPALEPKVVVGVPPPESSKISFQWKKKK